MAVTAVGSATSTDDVTITVPSGGSAPQVGDLIVIVDYAYDNASTNLPGTVVPSEFSTAYFSSGNGSGATSRAKLGVTYKISTGDEAGEVLTGMNGATSDGKCLVILRSDVGEFATVTPAGFGEEPPTNGDPASETTAASGGTPPLIVIGAYGVGGTLTTMTFSTTAQGTVDNTAPSTRLAWKSYEAAPADTTIDMADGGGKNALVAGYLQYTTTPRGFDIFHGTSQVTKIYHGASEVTKVYSGSNQV